MIIKWTNKYSGETGFVKSVSDKEEHFINTFDKKSAKTYKSESAAKRVITKLASYGEADANDFSIISA